MATTTDDSPSGFHHFIGEKLADGREMSPESALALWRERQREAEAIKEGLDALERGETRRVEAFLAELDSPMSTAR